MVASFRESHLEHSDAVAATLEDLKDRSIPAYYEAAFSFDGIRIRTDILRRVSGDAFDLVEVKSTTGVKAEHIPDVAIQLHVLEGSRVSIRKAFLLHIDKTYVYEGGPYDLDRLFKLQDVTEKARAYISSTVPKALAGMWDNLRQGEVPFIDTGAQCVKPYRCPFYGYCHDDEPEHSIQQLPHASGKLLRQLKALGFEDIRDIPSDFQGLSALQQRIHSCVVSGKPYVSQGLATDLSQVEYPVHFLDFETFNPPLPAYPGTRPYQVIPFQWSLHVSDSTGKVRHESYLHDDPGDPRRPLVVSLLDSIGPKGTIVVYSGFEERILRGLAAEYPREAKRLVSVSDRLFDLHRLLRQHYYHPQFHGTYSIKAVLPVLCSDMGYRHLEIKDGEAASVAFSQMITPGVPHREREEIRAALLDYCQTDTEAMLRILEAIRKPPQVPQVS